MNAQDGRRIGWIGLGVMGRPMAQRLVDAGHRVVVHNRSRAAMGAAVAGGAEPADSPAAAAAGAGVVFTMLPDTPDVEAVALGADGILEAAGPGTVVVDMSTISPTATEALAARAAERDVRWIDAPVTGGDVGARDGTLTIMAGGDREDLDQVTPLLEVLGRKVVYVGPVGSGQRMKLCNNVVGGLNLEALCEGLALARRSGLDARTAIDVLGGGAAGSWVVSTLGPGILNGDFDPGFKVRLHHKDLRLAIEEAGRLGFALPGAELVAEGFAGALHRGEGDLGTQALIRRFDPDPDAAEGTEPR